MAKKDSHIAIPVNGSAGNITIKDIARKAGVSPSTVSMVINSRPGIGEETRQRVLDIIQTLGYTPNLVARSLVKRHSQAIALLIESTQHPIFPEIAAGVDDVLKEQGYSLSIISTHDNSILESMEMEKIKARGIDGILTSAALVDNDNLLHLVRSGFPVVALLRRVYDCDELDYVVVDNRKGGFIALEHLIRLGHRRIGILHGPVNNSTAIERLEGAMGACSAYGVPVPEDFIRNGAYVQKTGYQASKELLGRNGNDRPTAIFASNDEMALGAFEATWEMGLNIPEDIALVGFNNVEITSFCSIQLTTVSQRPDEMGRLGAKRLVGKIEKKRGYRKVYQEVLEPELVVRKTCGYSDSIGYQIANHRSE
jgi:LacI family transcriptional regulator